MLCSFLCLLSNRVVFFLIRLCGNVIYRVEKSYVDKLVARNPLHFNLLSASPECFIDQNQFLFEVTYTVSPECFIDQNQFLFEVTYTVSPECFIDQNQFLFEVTYTVSPECFIDQNQFLFEVTYTVSQCRKI